MFLISKFVNRINWAVGLFTTFLGLILLLASFIPVMRQAPLFTMVGFNFGWYIPVLAFLLFITGLNMILVSEAYLVFFSLNDRVARMEEHQRDFAELVVDYLDSEKRTKSKIGI